ncbi:alpha/beta fold hydrolase [Microbulbifer sp. CnH-101-E]|uniref:alpha/beta fold hydrolase n=1 Tax=unclassified Microbulbifer TaxID=2619833 RepID=UPI0040396861
MKIYAAFLLSVLCCSVWAQDEHKYEFVTIGGNTISYLCKEEGEGKKVVLMVSGMGLDAHSTYKNTFHKFSSNDFMLCIYDRPGAGKSAHAVPKVRSMDALSAELEAFVEFKKWDSVVLVAHSFGGLVARAFASENPRRVSALLFVDAAHESWYGNLRSSLSKEGWATMQWIMAWEKEKHSFEDFAESASKPERYKLKKEIPITVMSRGLPHTAIRQTKMSYADVDAYNRTWDQSQIELTKISDSAKHVIMKYSSHLYDETDPWIILEELNQLLSRVKPSPEEYLGRGTSN